MPRRRGRGSSARGGNSGKTAMFTMNFSHRKILTEFLKILQTNLMSEFFIGYF